MIIVYIIYFGVFFAVMGRFVYQIIADNLEYRKYKPKSKKEPKVKVKPFTGAQITVARRESSGLTSFTVWDFFLNGESIGKIKDGASVTVETAKRINELTAKDSHGTESPPFKFFAENGQGSHITFNGGRFEHPQGMNTVLPSDEGFKKITAALNTKRWAWLYWVLLIGYYVAAFFLVRGEVALALSHEHTYLNIYPEPSKSGIFLAVFLPLLPIILLTLIARSAYLKLVDYLTYNYPEEWSSLSRDMAHSFWNYNLILYGDGVADLDYLKLKIRYEEVLSAQILSAFVYIAVIAYLMITAVSH